MPARPVARFLRRYRVALAALAISAVVHAAVFVSIPNSRPGVFTQRRFYEFHLVSMGTEEIEVPLGKVRTPHLRHVDPQDASVIDVRLGIDQHYLPVKLRYPVARNRLMVEQIATSISQ